MNPLLTCSYILLGLYSYTWSNSNNSIWISFLSSACCTYRVERPPRSLRKKPNALRLQRRVKVQEVLLRYVSKNTPRKLNCDVSSGISGTFLLCWRTCLSCWVRATDEKKWEENEKECDVWRKDICCCSLSRLIHKYKLVRVSHSILGCLHTSERLSGSSMYVCFFISSSR